MSSATSSRARDSDSHGGSPTGRILSAADYASLLASGRRRQNSEPGRIRQLPSLHEEAWKHGYQQGVRRAMSELESTLAELRACQHDRNAWTQHYVSAVLRKVLGSYDAETLVPLIAEQVVEECDRSLETLGVHVHPDVAGVVAKRLAKLTSNSLVIDVVPDDRLPDTGCEIHTPFGIIDAGLDTQMEALEYVMRSPDLVATHD